MKELIDIIIKTIKFNEEYIRLIIDDLDELQMCKCPNKGLENHPAWTIGHLFDASDMICDFLGGETNISEEWISLFRRKGPGDPTLPITDHLLYPNKEELFNKFTESHEKQIYLLRKCSHDFLNTKVEWAFDRSFSKNIELVHFMATWHETNHIAQLASWRRAMSLPSCLRPLAITLKNK